MPKVAPELIMQGLINRGFKPHEAAGITGNIAQESGFDTGARELNPMTESARKQGGGFGLFQFTNHDRKQGLMDLAQSRATSPDDLDTQLDYFLHELNTTHKKAAKALSYAKNPRQAAYVISKYYEMPSPKYANNAKRMGAAEQFFNMLNPISTANADEMQDIDPAEFAQWEQSQQQPQKQADIDPEEFAAWEASQQSAGKKVGEVITDIGGGVLKGASNIGNTILSAADSYNELLGNKYALSSQETTGAERRKQATEGLKSMGVDTDSGTYKAAELGTEIAGTAGTGGLLAKGAAKVAPSLVESLASSGMAGANLTQKAVGGAITGVASAGLVDPKTAIAGGVLGAALPPAMQAAGKAGQLVGKAIKGKDLIPKATKEAGAKAIENGFVIPPSQVKPTLLNRLVEGTAGKITTAQNASAANQEVSNRLAMKAIGAESLGDEGIAAVRNSANKAYDAIGKAGKFTVDDTFHAALDKAAARTSKFKEDFPGLKNNDVDSLIDSLKGKGEFSADTTIEAIKRLRVDASANKISMDAAKKELGRVQGKVAASLEDLVERNLEKSGNKKLLEDYRVARQTLAKAHSIEKAVDKSTGNINANKLVQELQKGKPLTGELKDIAEFAQAFPKAAQNISKMGSLPQTSPLDVASVSTLAMMAGHPGYMALLALRPTARKLALSKFIQSGLTKKTADVAGDVLIPYKNKQISKLLPSAAVLAGSQAGRQ